MFLNKKTVYGGIENLLFSSVMCFQLKRSVFAEYVFYNTDNVTPARTRRPLQLFSFISDQEEEDEKRLEGGTTIRSIDQLIYSLSCIPGYSLPFLLFTNTQLYS